MIRQHNGRAAALLLLLWQAGAEARPLPDFTELVRENKEAVVNISTIPKKEENAPAAGPRMPNVPENSPFHDFFRRFFEDQMPQHPGPSRKSSSLGSGFIISKDGYVITNHHVVADAGEIIVKLNDRREFTAEVVGTDKRSDLALLKIEGERLPVVRLGSSADLKAGQWVLAIGSPFGFNHSVTQGIISGTGRNLPSENYVPFIQTDVAINPGNSGGPLFNLDGEVIGVNSQIYSRTGGFMGLSFAVPVDVVVNVYKQLQKNGYVTRGWLGVLIQDVTRELAESFDMDKPHGALVAQVLPDSPAENAGVKVGDIITKFNGKEVGLSSDLPPLVGESPVEAKAPMEIIRQGKRMKIKVLVAELPEEEQIAQGAGKNPRDAAPNEMNLVVRELTDAQRKKLELPDNGVMVAQVMPGPGADAGIRNGDVILMLNNQHIKDTAQFEEALAALPRDKSIPILIQRRGAPTFLAFKLEADAG